MTAAADVCGFHSLKQGMSAGLLPPSRKQKSTGKSNLSAATPLSVSWMLTKVIIRYKWLDLVNEKTVFPQPSKSYTEAEMLRDIEETFRTLHKINMKLNPKKCMFGVMEGMFLGYTITSEGIKPCLDKTEVVLQLPSPRAIKELPLLVAPKPKEELIIYLSASYGAVSAVLMTERGTVQTPVYFISRALQVPELNYTPMILADFLIEKPDKNPPDTPVVETPPEPWTLFMDGLSCVDGSGAGLILTSPEGTKFTYALRFLFTASNNEAEYEALIVGLRIAAQMGVQNVQVLVEILKEKSIQEEEVATVIEEEETTWMTPITEYLKDGTLPGERKEASKLRIKARQYELLEGVLYKRSFLKSWLRTAVRGSQSYTARILLANYAPGCTGDDMMPTYRTAAVDVVHNDEELRLNLDLLEENRERATICEAKAKRKMIKYYNARAWR
ncbi:reverse transcriptase domain-containing protein [Tanacetum coccineum]